MRSKLVTVGFAVLLGLTGCGDTTEPPEVAEVRIAHLAPGAGSFLVGLDGRVLIQSINPLQHTFALVTQQSHFYTFENADTELSVEVPFEEITAVLLMNAPDPELRAYQLARAEEGQQVMVVNADTAAADLVVLLESDDTTTVTLPRGAGELLDLAPGDYVIRVHSGDEAAAETLSGLTLRSGDHGFIVIYPSDGDTARYGQFLL